MIVSFLSSVALVFILIITVNSQQKGCCTPDQWETTAIEVNAIGQVNHRIWYDAKNLLVRWDRTGNVDSPDIIAHQQNFINYTVNPQYGVPMEYLYSPDSPTKCVADGADAFYKWCYGPISSAQVFIETIMIAGQACSVWGNEGNGFEWISQDAACTPVGLKNKNNNMFMIFTDTTLGIKNPDVLKPPAVCLNNEK